jgi:hypothetical protein
MRAAQRSKEFRLLTCGERIAGAMLVTTVQSLICAFYEHFTPLNEARCGEAGKGAKNHFLQKGGVHHNYWST